MECGVPFVEGPTTLIHFLNQQLMYHVNNWDTMTMLVYTCALDICVYLCIGAIIYKNSKFGKGDGPVIYSNVDCYGHENIISECSKTMYPNFTCSNYYYGIIGILCLDSKNLISSTYKKGSDIYV